MENLFRYVLAALMVVAGLIHFVAPRGYVRIMPRWLPAPLALVYISGVAEIAGGVGLLIHSLQRAAAWGLIALLVAVFPANINMAINKLGFTPEQKPNPWILWGRLPLQFVMIAWVWLYTR